MGEKIYRKDIDGLRALAVMLVVLFHLDISFLAGGFIGVDVFFVISGFLITRNLTTELTSNGKISFGKFYSGRIKRLFPAFFITIVGSALAAWFILPGPALKEFYLSAVSASTWVSNIYFWLQAGYWDTASHTKPLLHTWSLSVEEQFYVVWPLMLFLSFKASRLAAIMAVLVVTVVVGFIASEWAAQTHPSAGFFFTPFRMFQFAIGGLCVFAEPLISRDKKVPVWMGELAYAVGIASLVAVALLIDGEDPFPGTNALIVSLGTALVILFGGVSRLADIARAWPSVFVGKISYSLYLVHWPVIVFYKIKSGAELDAVELSLLFILMVALSYLLHVLVEQPMRKIRFGQTERKSVWLTPTSVTLGSFACIFALCGMAFFVFQNDGFAGRIKNRFEFVDQIETSEWSRRRTAAVGQLCRGMERHRCGRIDPNKQNIVIIGDSHGPDALNVFQKAFPFANYLLAYENACPPVRDLSKVDKSNECVAKFNDERWAFLDSLEGADVFVFNMRWSGARRAELDRTFETLKDRGVDVILMGPGPHYKEDMLSMLARSKAGTDVDRFTNAQQFDPEMNGEELARRVAEKHGFKYLSKAEFFCPENICRVLALTGDNLNTIDTHHLTYQATQEYADWVIENHPDLLD